MNGLASRSASSAMGLAAHRPLVQVPGDEQHGHHGATVSTAGPASSIPLIPGMTTSVTSRSMRPSSERATSSASAPLAATTTA